MSRRRHGGYYPSLSLFLLITVMCDGDAIRMTTSQVCRRFRRMEYYIVTDGVRRRAFTSW